MRPSIALRPCAAIYARCSSGSKHSPEAAALPASSPSFRSMKRIKSRERWRYRRHPPRNAKPSRSSTLRSRIGADSSRAPVAIHRRRGMRPSPRTSQPPCGPCSTAGRARPRAGTRCRDVSCPRLRAYFTPEEIKQLAEDLKARAKLDPTILKFLGEQIFGKKLQAHCTRMGGEGPCVPQHPLLKAPPRFAAEQRIANFPFNTACLVR